jgi:hypothetical protein
MNQDRIKLTAELTEEEKASGQWIPASQATAGMNRKQRRATAARLRKQNKAARKRDTQR